MKEFVTALKAATEPESETIEATIDGTKITCYRPTPAQFAVAMSMVNPRRDIGIRMAGVIDFIIDLMDEKSQSYVVNRLMDRTDPFGLEEIEQIIEWMIEEWSGRPTVEPSGSTRSGSSGGRKSTRTTRTSATSSVSASTGT